MISRRSSPRRRWAGLTVMSVIIRSGSDVAAGVDRLVPARVRRHRDRAGADPRLGEPGPADRRGVGAHVLQPGGPEVVVRPGVLEPALQALDPAGHPRIGGVALLADVEGRDFEVGVLVRVGHPAKLPSRFDEFGEQLFTEVMATTGTIPWERVRRAGAKLTTPLHPDDYLRLLNPLWSSRELRGRIERVIPGDRRRRDAGDPARLGLALRPPTGPVRRHRRPGRGPVPVAVLLGQLATASATAAPSRSPCARCRRGCSPVIWSRAWSRARSCAWRCRRATSCSRTRRRSGCCSWSAAAGSRRSSRCCARSTAAAPCPTSSCTTPRPRRTG